MADISGNYSTIQVTARGGIARVTLNRPEVHNAFDETLIAELTEAVRKLDGDAAVRVLVLEGRGRSFCAGADLNWMKRMAGYTPTKILLTRTRWRPCSRR